MFLSPFPGERPPSGLLEELAQLTEGFSPADLKALAQEAALAAMTRSGANDPSPAVAREDFLEAVERHRSGREAGALTY
jgi:SpoVK/Ycf46/Vps4 family AAA+-type ATPase